MSTPQQTIASTSDEADCCWICLGEGGVLVRPCMCPRSVHGTCLARWQLQQAGREEERSCRFCNASLPDWKSQLAPAPPVPVEPVMVVSLGGKCVKMRVKPGPEGMAQFRQQVRELFNIPSEVEFECSFKCKAPSGETVQLDGLASYDAATHCASLMAAQRAAAAARRASSAPHQRGAAAAGPASGASGPDAGDAMEVDGPASAGAPHQPELRHAQPLLHSHSMNLPHPLPPPALAFPSLTPTAQLSC
ncbi:hypothetical protein HYH03_006621 [Edaphochlamys debaryana]|uniref:RING-CH-type domain-containing protein n=1 Tax=Edaphochlamys debaryana TaxID=47281 RepID=A0A835Y580_9CHLO|nr:hypothetical protein HYH03_006621 [Edaphochlamys debaryana]|eukprot:KAG2495352.1 hypothetical protein HYH03_006621 [Edaphochlamys debaryana]